MSEEHLSELMKCVSDTVASVKEVIAEAVTKSVVEGALVSGILASMLTVPCRECYRWGDIGRNIRRLQRSRKEVKQMRFLRQNEIN